MKIKGNAEILGGGEVINLRAENRTDDPANPTLGQIWFNEGKNSYMGCIGNGQIIVIAPLTVTGGGGGTPTPGTGDLNYTFQQQNAATVWNIFHMLGKNPSVSLVDSGGTEFKAQIEYVNINYIRITMTSACGGNAYLN